MIEFTLKVKVTARQLAKATKLMLMAVVMLLT